jgi:hypothetical protein
VTTIVRTFSLQLFCSAIFLLLSGFAVAPAVSATLTPQCPESYSVSDTGQCSCEGNACWYTFPATTAPLGYACGTCRWNYTYGVECYNCGDPSGSGSIHLHCDPHQRGSQKVTIPCPATGADWVTATFTCGWCL